jgi:hypothetical protein
MKITLEVSPKSSKIRSPWKQTLCCLPALATLLCAPRSLAAVPAVVADAQQTIGSNFSNSSAIAVAPNGTVYVADATAQNELWPSLLRHATIKLRDPCLRCRENFINLFLLREGSF